MASFNQVTLLGHLTRDPELRVTPKGTAICQFGLALNRKYRDAGGTLREEVTFVDLEAWDKAADNIGKYCTKGSQLLVQGRLKLDQWDDKTSGQKRSKLKVVVDTFQFLGAPSDRSSGGDSAGSGPRPQFRDAAPARQANDIPDEDVPF